MVELGFRVWRRKAFQSPPTNEGLPQLVMEYLRAYLE